MENITISPEQPQNDQRKKTWVEPELVFISVKNGASSSTQEGFNYHPYS
jgi:hypothetical protein